MSDLHPTNEHDVASTRIETWGKVGVSFCRTVLGLGVAGAAAYSAYVFAGKSTLALIDIRLRDALGGGGAPSWLYWGILAASVLPSIFAGVTVVWGLRERRLRQQAQAQLRDVLDQNQLLLLEQRNAATRAVGAPRRGSP